MDMEQRTVALIFRGDQDNSLYWSSQVEPILDPKRVWHVIRGDDEASRSLSHRDGLNTRDDGTGAIVDSECTKDVGCAEILQGLGEVPLGCAMAHQNDPQKCGISYISVTAKAQRLAKPP